MRSFLFIAFFTAFLAYPGLIRGQNTPPYIVTNYDSSSTGYYFVLPFKTGVIPGNIYQNHMIIDSTGKLVYFKSFPNGSATSDFKLQPNGLMSYSFAGKHFMMDSTFSIIDSVTCGNGVQTDVHDFQILPNGNYLVLGTEEEVMDLSNYFYFGPNNNAPGNANAHLKYAVVQELDTALNVVFEWHANDYFSFLDVDTVLLNNPFTVDWTHSNSVALDSDGNILLSSRNFNEITKINRQTGDVIWRLGGAANQFTFLNDTMQFKKQHDARRLSNGNLTLFDNGNGMTSNGFHFASAKEYHIDEIAMTAELVWSYTDDITEFSTAMGNVQRKPGEISIVDYGISNMQNKVFSAVNDSGNKVFQLEFLYTLSSYRTFNYKTLPWQLHRPEISCYVNNGQLYLDAGAGHPSYLWSTGDSTQIIPVSTADSFFVFVPYGDGGFISSEWIIVTNPLTYCGMSSDGIESEHENILVVNPVKENIEIYFSSTFSEKKKITISDISGKIIQQFSVTDRSNLKIPCSEFNNGVYFVRVNSEVFKIIKL